MNNEPSTPGNMPPGEITNDDRLLAALAYPISFIVSLIILVSEPNKNRPFQRFHAIQALAVNAVAWIAYIILTTLTLGLFSLCGPIIWLALLYPAYKAYQGEYFQIPYITEFIRRQGWI